jgi:hypothetical protein
MSPEIQLKLKKSISVVITRSKESKYHYEYFDAIVDALADVTFKAENKDLVI